VAIGATPNASAANRPLVVTSQFALATWLAGGELSVASDSVRHHGLSGSRTRDEWRLRLENDGQSTVGSEVTVVVQASELAR
jgi:hypothetical protein